VHSAKSGSDPIAALLGPGIRTLLWTTGALRVIGTALTFITEAPTGWYEERFALSHVLWPLVWHTNGNEVRGVHTLGA